MTGGDSADQAGGNAPIGALPAPGDLIAFAGKMLGQIKLDWNNVKGSQVFIVHMCDDPMNEAGWVTIGTPVPSKFTHAGRRPRRRRSRPVERSRDDARAVTAHTQPVGFWGTLPEAGRIHFW